VVTPVGKQALEQPGTILLQVEDLQHFAETEKRVVQLSINDWRDAHGCVVYFARIFIGPSSSCLRMAGKHYTQGFISLITLIFRGYRLICVIVLLQ